MGGKAPLAGTIGHEIAATNDTNVMTKPRLAQHTMPVVVSCSASWLLPAASQADVVVTRTVHFADASMLSTDAAGMTLDIRERPPHEYPHVGYRAPFTFEDAARDWA